jgi:polyhydroxybutyrate depolymerase
MKTARDRNGVKEEIYDQCAKTGEVVYYTVEGLGHIWPGGQNRLPEKWVGKPSDKLHATDVIWDFFKQHPRGAASPRARRAVSPRAVSTSAGVSQ